MNGMHGCGPEQEVLSLTETHSETVTLKGSDLHPEGYE